MKLTTFFSLAVAAVCVSMACGEVTSTCLAAESAPRMIHTVKTRFRIPYEYEQAEMKRLGAREIRLYVSTDRGLNWQHKLTVDPRRGRFEFDAPTDGEYWFAVKTLDARNQLHPGAEDMSAGLKVTVDTTRPVFQLSLSEPAPGKVELSWKLRERNLDPQRFRIEYIQSGSSVWKQVRVKPTSRGRTSWSLPLGGVVAIRGSVSDMAGNLDESEAQTRISPKNSAQGGPQFRAPVADNAVSPFAPRVDRFASNDSEFGNRRRSGIGTEPIGTAFLPRHRRNRAGNRMRVRQQRTQRPRFGANGRSRIVNTLKFQIGYKIDDVGPSGIGRIVLYVTQDNGRVWHEYGVDANRTSPFQVEVPRDGAYGFAIRVHSGVGIAAAPPRSGEKPPIVVVVDRAPPTAKLLPIQQGNGRNWNKILIRWNIGDANLSQTPVALSYAASSTGPWQAISEHMANTGRYVWTVGPKMPARIYIRLTARDAAGNSSRIITKRPVVVDQSQPSATFLGVE